MASIAKRLILTGAAAALSSLGSGNVVVRITSCETQNHCMDWKMTPSTEQCVAGDFTNDEGATCAGRWKVCMTIRENDVSNIYPGCPTAMITGTCPSEECQGLVGTPRFPTQNNNQCRQPFTLVGADGEPREYCQYGAPGDVLKFQLLDSGGDCDGEDIPEQATFLTVAGKTCAGIVSCRRGQVDQDKACPGGCSLAKKPCIHHFTIPTNCGCKPPPPPATAASTSPATTAPLPPARAAPSLPATTAPPPPLPPSAPAAPATPTGGAMSPGAVESMPPGGLNALGLAETNLSAGALSPFILGAMGVLGVALAAMGAIVVARRRLSARTPPSVREAETLEACLPEQSEG
mmetsp:Transcript_893/g.2851  ORF Transcript_893/g.2851 Transcript_893/m.2851 type:complete len:348 (+) Transcript_893:74-1117(+)